MDETTARQWVQKIVQVQSGHLTASDAAKQLGASRKTYHKHQKALLQGMLASLTQTKTGRPLKEQDEEKNALFRQVAGLQAQVRTLEGRLKVRQVMQETAGLEKKGTCDGDRQ